MRMHLFVGLHVIYCLIQSYLLYTIHAYTHMIGPLPGAGLLQGPGVPHEAYYGAH